MKSLWTGTKIYYNSIEIKFHRKGIELLMEKNKNLIVNIGESCKLYTIVSCNSM
jgi:hypothetical protein